MEMYKIILQEVLELLAKDQFLALPLTSCVLSGLLLNVSELQSL